MHKDGSADRIEGASAPPPLIGSDVKRKNIGKMYFVSTKNVFVGKGI